MKTENFSTNDKIIRTALRNVLNKDMDKYRSKSGHPAEIFEEFGVRHGTARIDIAVINGIMHGYEIKSDRDTLKRLPEQIKEFNKVFDKLTLVVGKHHLYTAINSIPDWWGLIVAKIDSTNKTYFQSIRDADNNPSQTIISIARLLWRHEALQILEKQNKANGVRSKPREVIYQRIASILELHELKEQVKHALLVSRGDWRAEKLLALNGDL